MLLESWCESVYRKAKRGCALQRLVEHRSPTRTSSEPGSPPLSRRSELKGRRDPDVVGRNIAGERAGVADEGVRQPDPAPSDANGAAKRVVEIDIRDVPIAVQSHSRMPNRAGVDPEIPRQLVGTRQLEDDTVDAEVGVVVAGPDKLVANGRRDIQGRGRKLVVHTT